MSFNIPDKDNSLQYHFVVTYDCETAEFFVDYETTSTMFHDAPVFDKSSDEWRPLRDDEWQRDGTIYNVAGDALFNILIDNLNKRWAVHSPS
jgi:hypothetical protein